MLSCQHHLMCLQPQKRDDYVALGGVLPAQGYFHFWCRFIFLSTQASVLTAHASLRLELLDLKRPPPLTVHQQMRHGLMRLCFFPMQWPRALQAGCVALSALPALCIAHPLITVLPRFLAEHSSLAGAPPSPWGSCLADAALGAVHGMGMALTLGYLVSWIAAALGRRLWVRYAWTLALPFKAWLPAVLLQLANQCSTQLSLCISSC